MPWRQCPQCGEFLYSANTFAEDWICPFCKAKVRKQDEVYHGAILPDEIRRRRRKTDDGKGGNDHDGRPEGS